jgi:hypothetical protein
MLEFKELEPIHTKLDEYKAAWMNEPLLNKVETIKERLKNEVIGAFPNDTVEAVDYFENQCLQIQARWGRPISDKIVH